MRRAARPLGGDPRMEWIKSCWGTCAPAHQKTGRRLVAIQKPNDGEARSKAVGRGFQERVEQVRPGDSSACGETSSML